MKYDWIDASVASYRNHARLGHVSQEEYRNRLEICEDCERLEESSLKCLACGHRCSIVRKAKMEKFECPLGKWPIVSPE